MLIWGSFIFFAYNKHFLFSERAKRIFFVLINVVVGREFGLPICVHYDDLNLSQSPRNNVVPRALVYDDFVLRNNDVYIHIVVIF
jgi:hypothetical protein